MSEEQPFTIEQFYRFIGQKKLMALKCKKCNTVNLPPRPCCKKCLSADLYWIPIGSKGKLVTYTVIYVAPKEFQDSVPYIYGIMEVAKDVRLPGIIRDISLDDLSIGMDLKIDFDTRITEEWPQWPRYFFLPAKPIT